jgi:drug/metabolite transporter (DMT)-like permease
VKKSRGRYNPRGISGALLSFIGLVMLVGGVGNIIGLVVFLAGVFMIGTTKRRLRNSAVFGKSRNIGRSGLREFG